MSISFVRVKTEWLRLSLEKSRLGNFEIEITPRVGGGAEGGPAHAFFGKSPTSHVGTRGILEIVKTINTIKNSQNWW